MKKLVEGKLLTQRSIRLRCLKTKSGLKCQIKSAKILLKFDLPGNANINVFFTEKSAALSFFCQNKERQRTEVLNPRTRHAAQSAVEDLKSQTGQFSEL